MQHNYSKTFILHTYDTFEDGYAAVKAGEVWGVAVIGANFTYGLYEKFFKCSASTPAGNDSIIAICMRPHPCDYNNLTFSTHRYGYEQRTDRFDASGRAQCSIHIDDRRILTRADLVSS